MDLRHAPADPRGISDRALRLARLGKLEGMGLASEPAPGRWQLSEKLEPTLRELGERGDIIKTMHKVLQAEGLARDPASFQIHDGAPPAPIVGRVIDKHLSDELGENLTLIIDGVDGRTHHVPGIDPVEVEDISIGSIVEIGSAEVGRRPADRAIAGVAEDGVYRPSRHLEQARFDGRVPGGDHDGFIDAHVRRLEALRRAGIVERIDADHWRLHEDFENRAAAYDARRNRQINIRVLSTFDLERQIEADGATWLDRRLVGRGPADLVAAGFGQEVQQAMDRRRERLIEQGDAIRHADGRIFYRRNLLATLEQRDVVSTGAALAASRSLPFRATGDGETVQGVLRSPIIPCTIFERLAGCRWCGDNATYRDQKCQGCAGSQDADEGHNRQREKKMIHFKLDSDTSFAQLTDGRLDRYGIATVTGRNGRLTATLIFDGTKILVRADQQNNVARLVPTADNPEIGYILNAISAESGVTFVADHEEAGLFLAGELA